MADRLPRHPRDKGARCLKRALGARDARARARVPELPGLARRDREARALGGGAGRLRELPAPHSRQVLAADAPAAAEYVPAGHCTQRLARAAAEYVPAGQLAQPAAPAPEYAPAPQSAHAALPPAALLFPAAHAEHGPPSAPV